MTRDRALLLQLGLYLLASGCTREAPRSVQTICTETPTYSSRWGSENQGSLVFGTIVGVQGGSFNNRLYAPEIWGSGADRYLSESCVAPYPLKGEPRWIQTATASVERFIGTELKPAGYTQSVGDPVEVLTPARAPWIRPGRVALIRSGAIVGFVPAEAVSEQLPSVERYVERLTTLLTRSELTQAELLARSALEHFPQEARIQRLCEALAAFNGSKPPTASGTLPDLVPLPELLVDPLLTLSEEEKTSTEGPLGLLRGLGAADPPEPSASAKTLSNLDMNQPLGLRSIDGDWARVTAYPGHKVKVSDGDVEFVDQPPVTGWAALRSQPYTLDPCQLSTQGRQALSAGRPEEATVLLHRALAAAASLGSSDQTHCSTTAHEALVQASFASGRFEDLFQWFTSLGQQKPAQKEVESPRQAVLLLGCHGKLAEARIYDFTHKLAVAGVYAVSDQEAWAGPEAAEGVMNQPHACIGGIDLREPMEPHLVCPEDPCQRPSDLISEQSLYSTVLRPMYRRWSEKVAARFNSSAYLYFRPRQFTERPEGKHLVFYSIPLEAYSRSTFSATLVKDRASVTEITFPQVSDWSQLEVWVSLPSYLDHEYGVALADSKTQVEEWIKQREGQVDYEFFRVPNGHASDDILRNAPFLVLRLPSLPSLGYDQWWRIKAENREVMQQVRRKAGQ